MNNIYPSPLCGRGWLFDEGKEPGEGEAPREKLKG